MPKAFDVRHSMLPELTQSVQELRRLARSLALGLDTLRPLCSDDDIGRSTRRLLDEAFADANTMSQNLRDLYDRLVEEGAFRDAD